MMAIGGAMIAGSAEARADRAPADTRLVVVGLTLAVPTWALGTVVHEGSHVIAAELVGADTVSFRPWPGRDPSTGAFQFGLTRVRGLRSDGDRLFFYMAPKLTDLIMLGGYLALYESDAYPDGAYGQLVLTVLATGFWVDFAKDVFVFSRHNDLVKSMKLVGLHSEWTRLPARVGVAAASAGLGYLVLRGYDRMFALNDETTAGVPIVLPLVNGRF
jgi:hypothetical protein